MIAILLPRDFSKNEQIKILQPDFDPTARMAENVSRIYWAIWGVDKGRKKPLSHTVYDS